MYATLNISDTSIKLLSIKGRQIRNWASVLLAPGMVRDGLILQPEAVGEAINDLFKSTKIAKDQVIVTLTGLSFTDRIVSLPKMKSSFVEEAILRGAREEIPLPLEELYLSWQAINSHDDEIDFFILGVPRNLVDAAVETLEKAEIKPYIMDLKPLALARAVNRGDALIVALEPECFDIVLVANGIPTIMHTITPRGEGANLEDNIHRLTDELSKTVKFYNNSHLESPLSPTTPLLLTGELATSNTVSSLIQAELEYPIESLVPTLEFPKNLPVALYTTNMGLALKKVTQKKGGEGDAVRFHDINLNILSAKYRSQRTTFPLRNVLLTLGLVILIGLLSPLYLINGKADAETDRLQTELISVSQELLQTRSVMDEAIEIDKNIDEMSTEIDSLRQEHQEILNQGDGLAENLILVYDALPAEAYFTSIEIGSDQIMVKGETDSIFAIISYVTALEEQDVFSEIRIDEIDDSITENDEIENGETERTMISFTIVINR